MRTILVLPYLIALMFISAAANSGSLISGTLGSNPLNTPASTQSPSIMDAMDKYGECMDKARNESNGDVNIWLANCGNCNANRHTMANAVLDNCSQMTPNWCLLKKCKPDGCAAAEPKCKATALVPNPTDPLNPGDADKGKGPKGTTPKPPTNSANAQPSRTPAEKGPVAPTGNPNVDTQNCDNQARRAQQCCNNPASCMTGQAAQQGPAPGQGLNEYCQQMRAAGMASGQSNNSASGTCYSAYNSCVTTCEGGAGSASGQAAEQMRQTANGCRSLQSRVSILASQGMNAQTSGGSGDICNNVSQSSPQSAPGGGAPNPNSTNPSAAAGNPNDPYGCQGDPSSAACQQCSSNPNSPACRALAYEKDVRGQASFGEVDKDKKPGDSGFNIQDSPASSLYTGNGEMAPQAVAKTGTVANNSGGSIPGGGGGAPAKMDSKGGGGSPGAPGYTTDILNGTTSGNGYSAPAGGDASAGDGGGGFAGYKEGARGPASQQDGIDLRRFLPGNDKDPLRRNIGGIDLNRGQINGKFVNIWNKISDRMQEKCRLGELIGCG